MKKHLPSKKSIAPDKLDSRWLERTVKGFANHRRIQILQMLVIEPELSLSDICDQFDMESANGSEHVRKLAIAGLVVKRRQKNHVYHKITDRGMKVLSFLKKLK